jgi:hypothetical protein
LKQQTTWDEIGKTNGPILVTANVANGRWIDGEHDESTPGMNNEKKRKRLAVEVREE